MAPSPTRRAAGLAGRAAWLCRPRPALAALLARLPAHRRTESSAATAAAATAAAATQPPPPVADLLLPAALPRPRGGGDDDDDAGLLVSRLRAATTVRVLMETWARGGGRGTRSGTAHMAVARQLQALTAREAARGQPGDRAAAPLVCAYLGDMALRLGHPRDPVLGHAVAARVCVALARVAQGPRHDATAEGVADAAAAAVLAGSARLLGHLHALAPLPLAQFGRLLPRVEALQAAAGRAGDGGALPADTRARVRARLMALLPGLPPFEATEARNALAVMREHTTCSMLDGARALLRAAEPAPAADHGSAARRGFGSTARGGWALLRGASTAFDFLRDASEFSAGAAPRGGGAAGASLGGAAVPPADAAAALPSGRARRDTAAAAAGGVDRAELRRAAFQLLRAGWAGTADEVRLSSRHWQRVAAGRVSASGSGGGGVGRRLRGAAAPHLTSVRNLTGLLRTCREALSMTGLLMPPADVALSAAAMRGSVIRALTARMAAVTPAAAPAVAAAIGVGADVSGEGGPAARAVAEATARPSGRDAATPSGAADAGAAGVTRPSPPRSPPLSLSDLHAIALTAMSTHWTASRAVYRRVGGAASQALAAAAATAPAFAPASPSLLTPQQLAELALVLGAAGEHAPAVLTALASACDAAAADGATLGAAAQAALLARGTADAATQAAGAAVLLALGGRPALLSGHVQRAVRHRVAMREYASALSLMSAALQGVALQSGEGGDPGAPAVLPLDKRWLADLPHGDALTAAGALDALVQSGASVLLPRARVAVRLLRDRDVVMQPWDERLAESRHWVRRLTRGVVHEPAGGAAGANLGEEAGAPPARPRVPAGFGGGVGPDEMVHVRVLSGRKHAAQGAPRFMASWQVAGAQPGAASALLAEQGGVEGGATHTFMACEGEWAHVELRLLAQAGWTVVAVGVHEWLAMEPWDRERLLAGVLKP